MIPFLVRMIYALGRAAVPLARLAGAFTGLVDAIRLARRERIAMRKDEHERKRKWRRKTPG